MPVVSEAIVMFSAFSITTFVPERVVKPGLPAVIGQVPTTLPSRVHEMECLAMSTVPDCARPMVRSSVRLSCP